MFSVHIYFIIHGLICLVLMWEVIEGYREIIDIEKEISHAKI